MDEAVHVELEHVFVAYLEVEVEVEVEVVLVLVLVPVVEEQDTGDGVEDEPVLELVAVDAAPVNGAADIEAFVCAVDDGEQDGFVGAAETEVAVGHGVVGVSVIVFETVAEL